MVVVVVIILHTGEFPDVRPDAAEESLSPAAFRQLWRNVCINGRESVHPLVDIIVSEHHFARLIVPFVDWVHQRRALRMLEKPSMLGFKPQFEVPQADCTWHIGHGEGTCGGDRHWGVRHRGERRCFWDVCAVYVC